MEVVGYRLNCFDKPVLMAVSKPLLTEFGIHLRLESSDHVLLPEEQRNNDTVSCAALGAKVPGHHREQLTHTLDVRLLKTTGPLCLPPHNPLVVQRGSISR